MCTTVLFYNSKWEKQHDNKLKAPQEVKSCCGIRDVNTLWGPESKSWNYLTQISYPDASRAKVDRFCSKLQESSIRCSLVNPSSLKLLCQKNSILEPLISLLCYTGFLYGEKLATWKISHLNMLKLGNVSTGEYFLCVVIFPPPLDWS